jgi:hypothetical protein
MAESPYTMRLAAELFPPNMPLRKGKENVGRNIKELMADNKKSGKARGANGKPRSMKQIKAIALNAAGVSKKKK